MRRVRAQMFALLAALVLLLPAGVWVQNGYYCRMAGRVVASCCCGARVASPAARHVQEAQSTDCCERVSASSRNVSFGTRGALQGVSAVALLPTAAAASGALPITGTSSACTERTQAPLAIGPPLFVAHCALLS